jgi:hypothetical protein
VVYEALIIWALPTQMGNMSRSDHDLRWDAANIYASPANRAALNERDARAMLNSFECLSVTIKVPFRLLNQ